MELPQQPIACSLTPEELTDRSAAWQKLLETSLVARRRVPGGLELTVHSGATGALHSLVVLERECCPWMTFQETGASVTLTAEGDGENVVVALFS